MLNDNHLKTVFEAVEAPVIAGRDDKALGAYSCHSSVQAGLEKSL
jgi:hypothetical protein